MISLENRDELLAAEHGLGRKRQKRPDEELWQQVPKGNYAQTRPVTLWTHNLENKNYYMSAGTGVNPFGRTNGMT